jgi:hypothetical protein
MVFAELCAAGSVPIRAEMQASSVGSETPWKS